MKKLWLIMLAVVLAFGLVFGITGCRDLPGDITGAEEDLVIEDADEIAKLLIAEGFFGSDTGGCSTDGNVMIFDEVASPDNAGFRLDFPKEAVGYTGLEVTFKLAEVTKINAPGFAKFGFKSAKGSGDVTPYEDHEVVWNPSTEGVEKKQFFSLNSPNKLPNNLVYISHNQHGSGETAGSKPPVSYKVEITKIVFKAGEVIPCCTDCPTDCKDCTANVCIGECGTGCCVTFASTDEEIKFVAGGTTAVPDKTLDTVVHTNPSLDLSGGTKVAADGTITMAKGAVVFYKFPADGTGYKIADYDYVDITYTLSDAVTTSGGAGSLKARVMDYKDTAAYGFTGGNWTDWGGVGANKTTQIQTWGDGGTGGFALRFNDNDTASSGCDSIKLKITKIVFSKGTRATVEFLAPQTPSMNNVAPLTVLVGNPMGDRMPKLSNPGWTFIGWNTGWDVGTGKPNGTAVGESTAIQAAWVTDGKVKLFAEWLTGVVPPISEDNPVFTLTGSYNTKFTFKTTNDWMLLYSPDYDLSGATNVGGLDFSSVTDTSTMSYIYYSLPTNAQYLKNLTITYDIMMVAPSSGDDGKGAQIRKGNTSSSGAITTSAYPWLADGPVGTVETGKTFTRPAAEFFDSGTGYFGINKGDTGAFLIRITKIEIKD